MWLIIIATMESVHGQTFQIDPLDPRVSLDSTVDYYEDVSGSLSFGDVTDPAFNNNFIANSDDHLHFGLTSSAYWLRFSLDWSALEPGAQKIIEIGPPKHVTGLARGGVDLYVLDSINNLSFQHQLGSYSNSRELRTLQGGYALTVDSGTGETYYLHVTTTRSLIVPITLWEPSVFNQYQQAANTNLGLIYGILIAMAVYNLFLYISIRETSFLFYVLAIASQLLFVFLDSKHLRFLTGNMLDTGLLVNLAERIVYPLLVITALLFQRSLLKIWEYNKPLDKMVIVTLATTFGVILLSFLPSEKPYQYSILAIAFFAIPFAFITNVDAIRRGITTATVHLAATSVFLLAACIMILRQLWSQFPDNAFTANAFVIGLITQALLLSFGLAYRYNQIKQEKEDAQQLAIQNLIRSEQIKDDLLANVSHELRTPLYGINGLAETALNDFRKGRNNSDLLVRNLELIQTSGDRLTRLVNDLLDFSTPQDDAYIKLRPVDLKSVITLVIAISKPLIGNKSIELGSEVDDDLPLVDGDENRLQQVLLNLTSNAIKFTYSGEVVITAHKTAAGEITVSVRDTGIGIHESDHESIFKSFEKVATPGLQSGGVGLGLPLAKRIVEMHGSKLLVESELDLGSTFSFKLRISKDQTLAVPLPTIFRQMIRRADFSLTVKSEQDVPKLRSEEETTILIVDDDDINRTLMEQQLDEYHTIECSNGFDALTIVEEKKPDLILLDLMMPGMNGYEVCQKLRQQYNQIELPIILVTAKNHLEDLTMGFNTGANDYLAKPYYHQELKSRVANQLKLTYLHRISEDNVKLRSQIEKYVQADAELRSSRLRLEQVLESISAGFIAFEYPGKIFTLNQRAAELLGTDRETLVGSRVESIFSNSGINEAFRSALSDWESGEKSEASTSRIDVEVIYPYNSSSRPSSRTLNFHCKLNLFSSDEGTGVLFLEDTEIPVSVVAAQLTLDTVELVGLLGQAQQNIRRVGTRLSVLGPEEIAAHPELLEKLMGIDSLSRYIDERLPEISTEGEYRQQLVTLMRSTLHTWEVTTQKTKIELAEESNIWAVSIDDGRLRTRTFDRYLRLEHLPKIPRWREVVRTAYFVLSNPSIEAETRSSLEKELERTKAILKRAAIN
ncbi:MAG: 7TM diverse intracellular signaling domain-containing protein [Pseudohongiellaceae bacterium]